MAAALRLPGNASSIHAEGRAARAVIEDAREKVAILAGAQPKNVVFTSGGTEANSLAILGILQPILRTHSKAHAITSNIEHASILEPLRKLQKEGLGVQVHYIPLHTQPLYRKYGFKEGDFPNTENYYKRALSIPIFADMKNNDVERVIRTIKKILGKYERKK